MRKPANDMIIEITISTVAATIIHHGLVMIVVRGLLSKVKIDITHTGLSRLANYVAIVSTCLNIRVRVHERINVA